MASYSVAEAKNQLPQLIDRARAGEEVVITRRGRFVARLTADPPAELGLPVDLEWLDRVRVQTLKPVDATELIRQMRDEGV